jgi:uncharacterized Zn finger protein
MTKYADIKHCAACGYQTQHELIYDNDDLQEEYPIWVCNDCGEEL